MMKKILIASKHEGVRESFKLILADNFDLMLCENPTTCPKVLGNADISILFLDIDGLENSGLTIAQCLASYPNLKIITIADHKKEKNAQETVTLGAEGYVIKPLKQDQIFSLCK